MADFDLVIRGGTLVDGSGGEPFAGDIAIDGDRIAALGVVAGRGSEEIDAGGCIVTPGFVDVHTHYDAQVLWDQQLRPSTGHGVTTVVMGNCAVGVAPCRADQRDLLIKVMAGVEDIPEPVMLEGLPWSWETFPEYLDALAARECDADFAAMLPHGPLRVYVMGQRGADREPASAAELAQMSRIVGEALEAGAIGFSTSRTLIHRTVDGALAPAETASEEELMVIARAMRAAGKGVIEYIADFPGLTLGTTTDFDLMSRFAETADAPLSFTLVEGPAYPEGWRTLLKLVEAANAAGVRLKGQVAARAVGLTFGLDLSFNPFSFRPGYREIAHLPLAERVARMRDPQLRARILAEADENPDRSIGGMGRMVEQMFRLGDPPDYEPPPRQRFSSRAAALGVSADAVAYDELLGDEGRALLYLPVANYRLGSLDQALEMMRHPLTVVALGDGGAHYGLICDATYPTFALTHWVRDRVGERLPLAWMVRALTRTPAESVGLLDRGLLAPGLKADVNVIDFARLSLGAPKVVYDLPSRGRRMLQPARGYLATLVSGQATRRDDQSTGVFPGRLVRGQRS